MQRAKQVCASLMVEVADANTLVARRAHKEAQCIARLMAAVNVAYSRVALRGLRAARLSARAMEVENGVFLKVVVLARKASMVVLTTAWLMEEGSDAQCLAVLRVPADVLTAA